MWCLHSVRSDHKPACWRVSGCIQREFFPLSDRWLWYDEGLGKWQCLSLSRGQGSPQVDSSRGKEYALLYFRMLCMWYFIWLFWHHWFSVKWSWHMLWHITWWTSQAFCANFVLLATNMHARPGNEAKENPVLTPDSLIALTKDNKCCLTKCVVMIYIHLHTGSELP